MKKKGIIVLISSLIIISILIIRTFYFNDSSNNIISNIEKDTEVINSNMITMMYETEAGTGIYEETKDTTWPENGYIFNENLSGCERGGELKYNSINKTVNLLSNKSDNCYVYFDKYDGIWIDNVSITNVTGSSVTLEVSATSENGSISKYYYSINDSEEYTEASSNIITINDLNKLTEYNISIYCLDSTNAKSNIYELNVSTTDISGPQINGVSVSDITYNSFTISITSSDSISRYYFSVDGGTNFSSSVNNYLTFTGLNRGTLYNIVVYAINSDRYESNELTTSATTEDYPTLAQYIINEVYIEDGENNLYFHDGQGSYTNVNQETGDNSYRYSGANPNNYVCFGSDDVPCPNDNLYRIIGVFGNEVKLIKKESYIETYWGRNSNSWSSSNARSILNGTYLSSFSSEWQSMISNHSWKVGGITYSIGRNDTLKSVYNYEVGSNSSSTTWRGKIGLMYLNDYGYANSPEYWDDRIYRTDYNWLVYYNWEWTITRVSDYSRNAFYIFSGSIGDMSIEMNDYDGNLRPAFYLNANVKMFSGSGTQSDPYRIGI